MDENSLIHYGVLGMKWGRRKQKPSSGSSKTSRREEKKITKEAKKRGMVSEVKKTKKVKIKELSDKELQDKIKRLQMEKQYRDLKKEEVSKGRKIVGQILTGASVKLGTEAVYKLGGVGLNKLTGYKIVSVDKLLDDFKDEKTKKKEKKDD